MKITSFITVLVMLVAILFFLTTESSFSNNESLIKYGEKMWKNKKLGGSTNSFACQMCHAEGNSLNFKPYPKYIGMAKKEMKTVEDMINFCIERPLKGKAISKTSKEMKGLVAYYHKLHKDKQ